MLSQSKDLPAVREMLNIAQRVLGYDLLERCTNGEPEKHESLPFVIEACVQA